MKKVLFLLAVGLCVVAVALAAPNFSGTWKMNAEKSDMGMGQRGASGAGGADRGGSGAGATASRGDRTGSAPSGGGEGRGAASGETASRGERGGGTGGGGMSDMTIKMTEKEMIVTQGTQETKYMLDGSEQTVDSGRGGELKYKATWAGNVLTIAGTRGDSPYKLTYEMSADGKTLTRTSVSGETTRKMVYDKQ